MLVVLVSETAVNLEREERASERDTEKGGESACLRGAYDGGATRPGGGHGSKTEAKVQMDRSNRLSVRLTEGDGG